jgi:hypothetical protein
LFFSLVLLAGYLALTPSIFFLAPFALLLLVSRPTSAREWIWLTAAIAGIAVSTRSHEGLFFQTVNAYGAFFAGGFVVAALLGVRSLLTRALIGVVVAVAGVVWWYIRLQLRFVDFTSGLSTYLWDAYRRGFPDLPATPPPPGTDFVGSASVSEFARSLADAMATTNPAAPAFLTLILLAGAWLSWRWYYQLIWPLLILIAAGFLSLGPALEILSTNLFLVLAALYAARGLAVAQFALRRVPPLFALALYLLGILILPFALFAIGVADTWLDLRRRLAPPQGAIP